MGLPERISPQSSRKFNSFFHKSVIYYAPLDIETDHRRQFKLRRGKAADKFETGTKAALAGGTTCIIDFAEQKKGKSLKEAIDDKRQEAEGEASCDYALHLTLNEWNDDVAEELGEIVKKETCYFKLYTAYDMMLDDGQI